MSKKKLKEISSFIFADDLNLSLEDSLFLSSLVIGFSITVIAIIIGSVLLISLLPVYICIVLCCFIAVSYYFVRIKGIVNPFKTIMAFISFIGVSVIWVFSEGIYGPNLIIGYLILILVLLYLPNRKKLFFSMLFILLLTGLHFVQYYRPDLIVGYSSEGSKWIDSLTTSIYSTISIYFIIKFLHKYYIAEKQQTEESEKKVQQKNDELVKLNSDKDRFIQILAHDLKNPFSLLLGFSDLLIKNLHKYDIEKIESQLKIIHQTTHYTYNLLEDLLLWSKSQSGKLPFKPEKVLFSEIFNDVISVLKSHADVKKVSVNYIDKERITVIADANMLKTILRNLISNAIKFTNENGQVTIYTEINHKTATIIVSDNGVGIEKERIPKLWDFTQPISTSGTSLEKGTGFGLLLCKEFVEKHSGIIWVESEFGKGSDFKFTMPLCNDC